MRVCVAGLWHLGCVSADCLAKMRHCVAGWDPDSTVVAALRNGMPPLFEPGLKELIREGLSSHRLSFHELPGAAGSDAEVIWVTFDTPVDDNDVAELAITRSYSWIRRRFDLWAGSQKHSIRDGVVKTVKFLKANEWILESRK